MPFVGGVFTPFFRTPPLPAPPARHGFVRPPVSLVPALEEEVTRTTPAGDTIVPTSSGTVQPSFNNAGWIASSPSGRVLLCFAYQEGRGRRLAVWTRHPTVGWYRVDVDAYVGRGNVTSPTVRAVPGREDHFGLAFGLDGAIAYRELRFTGRAYGLYAAWDHAVPGTQFDTPSLAHTSGGAAWVAAGATNRLGVPSIHLVRGDNRGIVPVTLPVTSPPSLPSLAIGATGGGLASATTGVVAWRELDVPGSQAFYTTVVAAFAVPVLGRPRGFTVQDLAGYRVDGSSAWDPGVAFDGNGFLAAWQRRPRGSRQPIIWNAGSLDGVTWTTAGEVCDLSIRTQNHFAHVAADPESDLATLVWEGTGGGPKLASTAVARLSRTRATTLAPADQYASPRGDNGLADDARLPVSSLVGPLPDATWPAVCIAGGRLHLAWFAKPNGDNCTLRYREATW